jgi:hypothetical protein
MLSEMNGAKKNCLLAFQWRVLDGQVFLFPSVFFIRFPGIVSPKIRHRTGGFVFAPFEFVVIRCGDTTNELRPRWKPWECSCLRSRFPFRFYFVVPLDSSRFVPPCLQCDWPSWLGWVGAVFSGLRNGKTSVPSRILPSSSSFRSWPCYLGLLSPWLTRLLLCVEVFSHLNYLFGCYLYCFSVEMASVLPV